MMEKERAGEKDARKKAQTYGRGVLQKMTAKTKAQAEGYPLYYTEWNTSAILPDECHDYPYSAALVTKTILDNIGYVEAYSFWTFTDIFEEHPQHRENSTAASACRRCTVFRNPPTGPSSCFISWVMSAIPDRRSRATWVCWPLPAKTEACV